MQDKSINEENKIIQALQHYYHTMPPNINLAVDKMLWFYRCGKDISQSKGTGKGKSTQIYDFEYDDDYIYSAFLD